jgi:hypothetical protein
VGSRRWGRRGPWVGVRGVGWRAVGDEWMWVVGCRVLTCQAVFIADHWLPWSDASLQTATSLIYSRTINGTVPSPFTLAFHLDRRLVHRLPADVSPVTR